MALFYFEVVLSLFFSPPRYERGAALGERLYAVVADIVLNLHEVLVIVNSSYLRDYSRLIQRHGTLPLWIKARAVALHLLTQS